jgi:hypothetical protein
VTTTYDRVLAFVDDGASASAVAARAWQFAKLQAGRLGLAPLSLAGTGLEAELDGPGKTRLLGTFRRKLQTLANAIGAPEAEPVVGETLLGQGGLARTWLPSLVLYARMDGGDGSTFRAALSQPGLDCDVGILSLPKTGFPFRRGEPRRYAHILAIGDMSAAGLATIARAADLSKGFGSQLTIASAFDYSPGLECGQLPVMTPSEFRRASVADLRNRLGHAAARHGVGGCNVIVAEGSQQEVQAGLTAQLQPDLIVTSGSPASTDCGLGETAHDVLNVHTPNAALRFAHALAVRFQHLRAFADRS